MSILDISRLSVDFHSGQHITHAVSDVSLTIEAGEIVALVGESGSGKSTLAHAVLRLLPEPQARYGSESAIRFRGKDLHTLTESELQAIRGNDIAMIFQEPMTALNPLHSIGKQLLECVKLHQALTPSRTRHEMDAWLKKVGLSHLIARKNALPHELSGGERQRLMIAMAMINNPKLLIADEPTTALDVTTQQNILALLKQLQKEQQLSILLITHDLTLVKRFADRIAVMQEGKVVEEGTVEAIFNAPQHPYTQKLIASEPKGEPLPLPAPEPLMQVKNLTIRYAAGKAFLPWKQQYKTAVERLNLTVHKGETVGVVGESGSGKSTTGLALLRLIKSEGTIVYAGKNISEQDSKALRPLRKDMQVVFQDPFGSLSPRMTVKDIIEEGLKVHGIGNAKEREEKVRAILGEVGLPEDAHYRYPHEFSGGQRQRISIARAFVLNPSLVVLDEPTSALDLTIQTQILDLLKRFQEKYGVSYLFISHDLRVIRSIAHRIIVMKNGSVVEQGENKAIFSSPQHSYTQALLKAALLEH